MSEPRLTPEEAAAVLSRAAPIPQSRGASTTQPEPFELKGTSVQRQVVFDALDHRVLLLFVSANCDGCAEMLEWERVPSAFGLDAGDEVVVVVRTPEERDLIGADLWVAPGAFEACRVSGAPFFVLLDPAFASVATEGVVWGISSVVSAIEAVKDGRPSVEVGRLEPPR